MSLKKIVCGSILLAGLASLLGCDNDTKKYNAEKEINKSYSYTVEDTSGNEYRVFMGDPTPKFFLGGIFLRPRELTGISAEITVLAYDKGNNAGIEKLILYEDGKEIFSTNDSVKTYSGKYESIAKVPVRHNKPGIHKYQAEVIDKGGNKVKSRTSELEFTGKLLDLSPRFLLGGLWVASDGDLCMDARDDGDNKGLKEVVLYEDGNIIRKFKCKENKCNVSISLASINEEGRHVYFAEAIDIGGNVTRSRAITVHYKR